MLRCRRRRRVTTAGFIRSSVGNAVTLVCLRGDARSTRLDVLVVAEEVAGVPLLLQRGEPPVLLVPVRTPDALRALVAEEVHVDPVAGERLEGRMEPASPLAVALRLLVVLGPDGVDVDVVSGVALAEGGLLLVHTAHGAAELEGDAVRERRGLHRGVLDKRLDRALAKGRELRGLPVVVPAVGDGGVEHRLELGVRPGLDRIKERRTERPQGSDDGLAL